MIPFFSVLVDEYRFNCYFRIMQHKLHIFNRQMYQNSRISNAFPKSSVFREEEMDLRIVKTKRAIKEAFLQIRAEMPLEKVKVRDICKLALINKSTFYHHYEDVFALSDELENEVLEISFNQIDVKDYMFHDPKRFFSAGPKAMDLYKEQIDVLFGGRMEVLFMKLDRQMMEHYMRAEMSERDEILLTFVIGGGMHAMRMLKEEGKYSDDTLAETMAEIIQKICELPGIERLDIVRETGEK